MVEQMQQHNLTEPPPMTTPPPPLKTTSSNPSVFFHRRLLRESVTSKETLAITDLESAHQLLILQVHKRDEK